MGCHGKYHTIAPVQATLNAVFPVQSYAQLLLVKPDLVTASFQGYFERAHFFDEVVTAITEKQLKLAPRFAAVWQFSQCRRRGCIVYRDWRSGRSRDNSRRCWHQRSLSKAICDRRHQALAVSHRHHANLAQVSLVEPFHCPIIDVMGAHSISIFTQS